MLCVTVYAIILYSACARARVFVCASILAIIVFLCLLLSILYMILLNCVPSVLGVRFDFVVGAVGYCCTSFDASMLFTILLLYLLGL